MIVPRKRRCTAGTHESSIEGQRRVTKSSARNGHMVVTSIESLLSSILSFSSIRETTPICLSYERTKSRNPSLRTTAHELYRYATGGYSTSSSDTNIVLKRKPEQRAAGRGNCWGSVNVSMSGTGSTFF